MPVLFTSRRSLDELIDDVRQIRALASEVIDQSVTLQERTRAVHEKALAGRLRSRRRSHYARIEATVDGSPTVAVVHRDGTVHGEKRLLQRVELVVSLGESFAGGRLAASKGRDPLATTLTTTRACDAVHSVEVYGAGSRPPSPRLDALGRLGDRWLPVAPVSASLTTAPPFHVVAAVASDGVRVQLLGEFDVAHRDELRRALSVAIDAGTDVVADLGELSFIDAAGLSELIGARDSVTACGHGFRLVGARGIVRRVFSLCRLEEVLDD